MDTPKLEDAVDLAGCRFPMDGPGGTGASWLGGVTATVVREHGEGSDVHTAQDEVWHEHIDSVGTWLLWRTATDLQAWTALDESALDESALDESALDESALDESELAREGRLEDIAAFILRQIGDRIAKAMYTAADSVKME